MYLAGPDRRPVIPRTELAYPAHRLDMHEKAARAPVDLVMADFEDACPYDFKGESVRRTTIQALNTIHFGERVVVVRPNAIRTKWFQGDLESVVLGAVDRFHGIVLPKAEKAADIVHLSQRLTALEGRAGWSTRLQIEALIETPLGLINSYKIACASNRMAGLIFGVADFGAALGVRNVVDNQNERFHYAKQAVVVAAKAAGLHAIDSVYARIVRNDTPPSEASTIDDGLRAKNTGAADIGMDGSHDHPPTASRDCKPMLHAKWCPDRAISSRRGAVPGLRRRFDVQL